MTDPFSNERVQAAYDVAAADYQDAFGDDLAQLPMDRDMLDQARRSASSGVMLDLGCGTGSAGSYLSTNGARVVGLDLSRGMLRFCRTVSRIPPCQGDMRFLPFGDGTFTAVVAYYSIHSVTRSKLGSVLTEVARVLKPRGTFLLSTHLGEGEVYIDEFLGHQIATVGGSLYSPSEIADHLSSSGFAIGCREIRGPMAHEYQSQRIYLLAERTY